MDAIDALSGGAESSTPNRFSELSSDEFMKIIFTELEQQDPLAPNDSSALLEQLSSLRSIQSGVDLSTKLEELVLRNELSSASALIGATVSGIATDNQRIVGEVRSISRTDEGAFLNFSNGVRMSMSNVDEVLAGAVR